MEEGKIIFFTDKSGDTNIQVKMESDTLWLSQRAMSQLFEKDSDTIGLHIKNIFTDGELNEPATTEHFTVVQQEGNRQVKRTIIHYNLDVIISVGYRVNSKRGTQFRIWANKVLKDYLVKGYALNEQRLKEVSGQLEALKNTVKLLGKVQQSQTLSTDETSGLIKVVTDYAYALDILDKYDHRQLTIEAIHAIPSFTITYDNAMKAIRGLKDKFGGSSLFGNEKDDSFKSSVSAIYQSFDGKDLYPSVEEKAAHLLYFIIKNHSFSDGNKRIAAFLFVWFLEKNFLLYRDDGSKRIADNALVALTLMIAESDPDEKDIMARVVVNLINTHNS